MSRLILVSGDCVCDHNVYKGNRTTADSLHPRGVRVKEICGGALLLKKLIDTTMAGSTEWRTEFGTGPDFKALPSNYHAFCLWEPQIANPGEKDLAKQYEVWRAAEPPLGYGQPGDSASARICGRACPGSLHGPGKPKLATPEIIVIDDAGLGFRHAAARDQWPFATDSAGTKEKPWVILKLAGTIGEGDLWQEVTARHKDKLVLVVSADQLRSAKVRISRGLSWEATAEDLAAELSGNPILRPLLEARHLIVTFRSDAAFWMDNHDGGERPSVLVFDGKHAEGEWSDSQGEGTTFGFMSCFVAAVVRELCLTKDDNPDFESALVAGLGASRELRSQGHGRVKIKDPNDPKKEREIDNPTPGFPFDEIAAKIQAADGDLQHTFVSALIPQGVGVTKADGQRARGQWMMLDEWQMQASSTSKLRPHYDAAMAVAVLGPEALERFPVAQFGSYQTVDRKETESLRTIRHLIINYTSIKKQKTPLNLGVFGPPGSGKSYIVIEIAKAVGIKDEDVKVFNLSQFSAPSDLFGAFHQVRDMILRGITPLIFWDEFDAQGYKWLQYLLAPMEDGEFQDGQITHPIGKCIFVFAGATSSTFDKFGPCNPDQMKKEELDQLLEKPIRLQEVEKAWKDFVLAKGPDFKSRLVGYLNILGVNRKLVCQEKDGRRVWSEDERDLCFPIRRAFFMRSLFKIKTGSRLELDPQVIKALLEMPKFNGGGRSLQFLCNHLKNSCAKPGRSNLPGYELLNMHVDAGLFWELCEQDMDFGPKAASLASLLHRGYRLRTAGNAEKKDTFVEFEDLPEDLQKANVAQALRIPGILRLAGMHLEKGDVVPFKELIAARRPDEEPLRQHLAEKDRLEVLAEAEHNGWMVERMLSGWKYSRKKDKSKKLHDCLIPYSQLTDDIKDYDRLTITGKAAPAGKPDEVQFGYVDMVKIVGLRVVMDKELSVTTAGS